MKGVFSGKDVRTRQPHETQAGAVGSAANRPALQLQARPLDRLGGLSGHRGVVVQHFLHIAVLFLDRYLRFAVRVAL